MRYSVLCKVYTGYHGTGEIEHGLCMVCLTLGDYLSVQADKPCSISHLKLRKQMAKFATAKDNKKKDVPYMEKSKTIGKTV